MGVGAPHELAVAGSAVDRRGQQRTSAVDIDSAPVGNRSGSAQGEAARPVALRALFPARWFPVAVVGHPSRWRLRRARGSRVRPPGRGVTAKAGFRYRMRTKGYVQFVGRSSLVLAVCLLTPA